MIKVFAKIFLVLVVGFLMFSTNSYADNKPTPQIYEGQITWLSDADSFKIKSGGLTANLRAACIDAPEIPHDKLARETTNTQLKNHFHWGEIAISRVKQILPVGSIVKFEPTDIDYRYGRTVAVINLPDGSTLQELLLREGLAQTYDTYLNKCNNKDQLLKLQSEAKANKVGIWRDSSYISPEAVRKLVKQLAINPSGVVVAENSTNSSSGDRNTKPQTPQAQTNQSLPACVIDISPG